jgi:hypothetical protein
MVAVRTTTEEMPELAAWLEQRHALGQDTYDEWWDGEYRTMPAPSAETDRLLEDLVVLLEPLALAADLLYSVPTRIGTAEQDFRVAQCAFYDPDTPEVAPGVLETARLVIEVLPPGAFRSDFYGWRGIREYLEIHLDKGVAQLWRAYRRWAADGEWLLAPRSSVLRSLRRGRDHELLIGDDSLDLRNYRPAVLDTPGLDTSDPGPR